MTRHLREKFREMMLASYGPGWSARLSHEQLADTYRAFMAGAMIVATKWMADMSKSTIMETNKELSHVGKLMHDNAMLVQDILGKD